MLEKVLKLKEMWDAGLVPTLEVHEVYPNLPKGSREAYLYFTLPPCINFQRNSPAMWQSALKTFEDPETNYVFFPEKVIFADYEKFKADMAKHNLALLRNKHCEIWFNISRTLLEHYDSNPKNILLEADFDVAKIQNLLQKEKRELFPHLRGTKLTNYWLMIINHFTDANLKNKHKISIIPDTHVLKASYVLGVCKENEKPELVAAAWEKLLEGTNLSAVELHPILWNWSRNGFNPEV